jgi:hypothetical protein
MPTQTQFDDTPARGLPRRGGLRTRPRRDEELLLSATEIPRGRQQARLRVTKPGRRLTRRAALQQVRQQRLIPPMSRQRRRGEELPTDPNRGQFR